MLERKAVQEGYEYLLNGEIVVVCVITRYGRGEFITLCDRMPPECENPFPYLRKGTIQMRKFQRQAKLMEV